MERNPHISTFPVLCSTSKFMPQIMAKRLKKGLPWGLSSGTSTFLLPVGLRSSMGIWVSFQPLHKPLKRAPQHKLCRGCLSAPCTPKCSTHSWDSLWEETQEVCFWARGPYFLGGAATSAGSAQPADIFGENWVLDAFVCVTSVKNSMMIRKTGIMLKM